MRIRLLTCVAFWTGTAAAAEPPPAPPSVLPASVPAVVEPTGMVDLTPPELAHPPAATAHATDALCGCAPGERSHGGHAHSGWFAAGDFLLWRPRMDSLNYAVADATDDLVPRGRVQNLRFAADGGFRVNLGYRLPKQGWDVGVTYTYYRSDANESTAAPPGGLLYPTLTRPGVIDSVSTASATAGLTYNVFDADIGRTWNVDEHLALRTFGGIRFASIDTEMQANYDGRLATFAQVRNDASFSGTGPTLGAEARWNVCKCVSLFGNARGGLIYGDFAASALETNGAGAVVNADLSDNFTGVAPFGSIALGGTWTWRNISLTAGYEVTHWSNVVARPTLVDDFAEGKTLVRRSDLSFDGVFFRVAFGY